MRKLRGYISNYEEAVLIVHAARFGGIQLVTERLNAEERELISSGDIFCFIENEAGMKRWTDGRIWSPSKICGEFLIYQEVPRHMSKNSIKKRKEIEKAMERVDDNMPRLRSRDDSIDRTTLHKKTVCIKYEESNYHIIAYYRPIFVNSSLMDMPYFKRLATVISENPALKQNHFLEKERASPNFFDRYNLIPAPTATLLDANRRTFLENIAVEVLSTLSRSVGKRGHAQSYEE